MSDQRHVDEIIDIIKRVSPDVSEVISARPNGVEGLAGVVEWLQILAEDITLRRLERANQAQRFSELMESITAITALDFEARTPISERGDIFDAIATGVNALGEELQASAVSRDYLDNIIQTMKEMLVVTDADGTIRTVNQATLTALGYQPEELEGQQLSLLFGRDGYTVAELLDGEVERELPGKDGNLIPVSCSVSAMHDDEGKQTGVVFVAQGISQRKQSEETLRASEEHLSNLMKTVGDAILTVKMPKRIIEYVNPAVSAMFGYSPEELIGQTTRILLPDEAAFTDFGEKLQASLENGQQQWRAELQLKRKNGEKFWAEITVSNLLSEGKFIWVISSVRDISQRKQAEVELRNSEETLRIAIEGTGRVIWTEDLIPGGDFDRQHESDDLYPNEARLLGYDEGEVRWIHGRSRIIRNDAGEPAQWIGIDWDITERKQAEEALRRQNLTLQTLNELSIAVSATLEVGPILDTVLRLAAEAIDATSAYITDWNLEASTATTIAEYIGPQANQS